MTNQVFKSIKKTQVQKYFQFIIKNKFKDLEKLLNRKVKLLDGKIKISGKKRVIDFTKKIFFKKKFKFYNKKVLQDKNNKIVLCKFGLNIDRKKLEIIDVFDFDKDNKILSITVYKR